MRFHRKIRSILCASLLLAGCSYRPFFSGEIKSNLIKNVEAQISTLERVSEKVEDDFDYGKLSWREVIEFVKTPSQAQNYNDWILEKRIAEKGRKGIDNGKHIYSFRRIHEGSGVDCTEGVVAAAALLSDNGYPPLFLRIFDKFFSGHMVFIYKKDGKFGSVGLYQRDYTEEQESLEEIIKSIYGGKTYKYKVYNLKENFPDFIDGRHLTTAFPD